MCIDSVPEKKSKSFSPVISTILQPSQSTPMQFRYNTPTNMAPVTNLASPSQEINSQPQSNSENLAFSPVF